LQSVPLTSQLVLEALAAKFFQSGKMTKIMAKTCQMNSKPLRTVQSFSAVLSIILLVYTPYPIAGEIKSAGVTEGETTKAINDESLFKRI